MTASGKVAGGGTSPPRIERIVELAAVSYWETDAQLRYTALVAPAQDRERPLEHYIGRCRWELPGVVGVSTPLEQHRAAMEAHVPFHDFRYYVAPPGYAPRYVSASGVPVFAEDGSFAGYHGTSRNITEETLASQRLREAETLLAMAGGLSRIRAWSIDVASGELTWSAPVGDGRPPRLQRFSHTEILKIYTPASRRLLQDAYDECVARGTPYQLEVQAIVRGEPRWVRLNAVPGRDASGRVVRVQGAFQDITQSKRASEQHRLLAQRLASTLDALPFGFGTVDGRWRITFVNPAAVQILGRSRDSLLGCDLWEALPGLGNTSFGACYRRAMAQRSVEQFEGHYEPLAMWAQVRAFPFEDGIAITFSDVTRAWQAQQEVARLNSELEQRVARRTAQLEAASRELEAFAYTVAHDLRAPLAAIAGYGRALEQSTEQQLGPRSSHYLERIQAAAQRMDQMTEAILSLSKLNRLQLRRRPVDLAELARQCLALLHDSQPQRLVECRVPASLPVDGDPALLHVLMSNLLGNAWKYTGQRTHAVIEVGRQAGPDGQTVHFVRDNGVGFDAQEATRLFEPFSRIHGPEFEGTGIGLATVQRVVLRHGGRVWAQAQPDAGATFFFTLPPDTADEQP
jgi:signal transduction histidine kinase